MSDIFKDNFGINTEETSEYKELLQLHLASELTQNTSRILNALTENPDPMPHRIMQGAIEAGFGVSLEEDTEAPTTLVAQFLDNSNKQHGNIMLTMTEEQEPTQRRFSVDKETFGKLKDLVLDPAIAMGNVQTKIGKAI